MDDSVVLPAPWEHPGARAWSALRKRIGFDAAVLHLTDPARPDVAGVLDARSVTGRQIAAWQAGCPSGDPLMRRAAKSGLASPDKPLAKAAAGLPAGLHAVVAAGRCAPAGRRFWVLALGRKKKAYTDAEARLTSLALSVLRARFDTVPPGEAGMSRVLAEPGGRVMHVDQERRLSLGGDVSPVQALVEEVLAIEAQRWPGRPGQAAHDVFPPADRGGPLWVRVSRLPGPGGALFLALRRVHGVAPPGVGLIEDGRVAQAVGHLTDEFADAPPLNDLAARFEVSPFHFHRLFTTQAQISPKHLVLRVQLVHARWLLRTTLDPIREIAERCGFSSHGHFTATFHRIVGLTPLDYRLGQDPPA